MMKLIKWLFVLFVLALVIAVVAAWTMRPMAWRHFARRPGR